MEQAKSSVHRLTVVAHAAPCGMGHGGDECPKECPEVGASNDERPEVGAADGKEANCCKVGAYVVRCEVPPQHRWLGGQDKGQAGPRANKSASAGE